LNKKKVVASGILLALCATACYLLLHDKMKLRQIKKRITDRLELLDEPYC